MKKVLLIIILTLCIFQMVVLATAIDIGTEAKKRLYNAGVGSTLVVKGNPANASGIINSIEIYVHLDMTSCEIATFYVVSGNNLSTRDSVSIGSVATGAKRTFTTDSDSNPIKLEVEEGDYIGIHSDDGDNTIDVSGGSGVWYINSDQIPCTNETFNLGAAWTASIYATGVSPSADNAIFFGMNF